MATNFYFQSGIPGGRVSESNLIEDLIIECLKIYGFDVFYLPRQTVYQDNILNEDALNNYESAYALEMYMSNVNGFSGEGDLMSKFGVEIRDTASFVVSRRRWDQIVGSSGNAVLTTRPAEGDIIYFPATKAYFEIKFVEALDPFFQVGKLYVYRIDCELMVFSGERFNTGVPEIDKNPVEFTTDINEYNILLEDGYKFMLEYYTPSPLISESYDISQILPNVQNEPFKAEISVLDFSETNPFGEIHV